ENFPSASGGNNQLASARGGNFGIYEQILQFHRRFQSNRLKTVAGLPMAQNDFTANLAGVEIFAKRRPLAGGLPWRQPILRHPLLPPVEFPARELRLALS